MSSRVSVMARRPPALDPSASSLAHPAVLVLHESELAADGQGYREYVATHCKLEEGARRQVSVGIIVAAFGTRRQEAARGPFREEAKRIGQAEPAVGCGARASERVVVTSTRG